ncbi:MAG: LysE family translocator, partial [Stackebrandtia sp.]
AAGQLLTLGATLIVFQIAADGLLGAAAGRLGRALLRRPRLVERVNAVTGSVFIGLGARLAAFG